MLGVAKPPVIRLKSTEERTSEVISYRQMLLDSCIYINLLLWLHSCLDFRYGSIDGHGSIDEVSILTILRVRSGGAS